MSAIIKNILDENREKIFTQTELIDEIEIKVGKRKSKSAVSQSIKALYTKNLINYTKGIGKTPAQISFKATSETKPKPIETKPKPIETKPKPSETKPKPNSSQIISDTDHPITESFDITKDEKYKELKRLYQRASKDRTLFKEALKSKEEELKELKSKPPQIEKANIKLETFTEFSQNLLYRAKKSGSNSYRIGEIVFRKTDLKNMYLVYSEKILDMQN